MILASETTAAAVAWKLPAAALLAAVVAFLVAYPVRAIGRRLRIMDRPGARSSHTVPVPRTGGIAILAGALAGLVTLSQPNVAFLVAAGVGVLVAVISFLDDLITIPSLPRLGVHLLVAGLTIGLIRLELSSFGLPFEPTDYLPTWLGMTVAVLFVVGFVNFFNFMDGINGIAAAQGIWGGLTLSLLLLWGHQQRPELTDGTMNSVLTAAALAGGCLGFLPHNFPRARMFMGDVGSTTIGFVLAMLTLIGANHTHLPWVAFVLPLGVFIYDATFTLFKRILRHENFLKPHREHHYQLLIRCGWSHAKVTALQMGLMTLCCAAALLYACGGDVLRAVVLATVLAVMILYSVLVHRHFRTHRLDAPAGDEPTAADPHQGRTGRRSPT